MSIDAAIQCVRDLRRQRGWTLNRLAREAGLSESTIRKFDDEDWNPTAETLRALESAAASPPAEPGAEERAA